MLRISLEGLHKWVVRVESVLYFAQDSKVKAYKSLCAVAELLILRIEDIKLRKCRRSLIYWI